MWASFRDIATPTEMHSTSTESSVLRPVKKRRLTKKKVERKPRGQGEKKERIINRLTTHILRNV